MRRDTLAHLQRWKGNEQGLRLFVARLPNHVGLLHFFVPVSKWIGAIFFEHTHRLIASAVGFLTIILAIWLWRSDPRRWVRNLGAVALGAVILQGVLGGLRVTMLKDEIGIFMTGPRHTFSDC